jgi:hypothetical protein
MLPACSHGVAACLDPTGKWRHTRIGSGNNGLIPR